MRIAAWILACVVTASLLAASCANGDSVVRLGPGSYPAWSPDGSRIAFVSPGGGIYLMDADGSNPVALLPGQLVKCPAWSPDGSRIAFLFGSMVITISVDGEDPRGFLLWCCGMEPRAEGVSWSPNGERIASSSARKSNWQIYVVNIGESGSAILSPEGVNDREPTWSPDGTQIAFASDRDGPSGIYVMNADGSDPVRLTDTKGFDLYPTWSPNGNGIAFISNRDGQNDIYIMDADGNNVIRLTENDIFEMTLDWSPDGSKIVFGGHSRDADGYDIYVVGVPG